MPAAPNAFSAAFSVVFSINRYQDLKQKDEAIVMTPVVNVKSTPSRNSVDLFVLHEGAKVRILDAVNVSDTIWNKIKIADGQMGFLPAEDMIAF